MAKWGARFSSPGQKALLERGVTRRPLAPNSAPSASGPACRCRDLEGWAAGLPQGRGEQIPRAGIHIQPARSSHWVSVSLPWQGCPEPRADVRLPWEVAALTLIPTASPMSPESPPSSGQTQLSAGPHFRGPLGPLCLYFQNHQRRRRAGHPSPSPREGHPEPPSPRGGLTRLLLPLQISSF